MKIPVSEASSTTTSPDNKIASQGIYIFSSIAMISPGTISSDSISIHKLL